MLRKFYAVVLLFCCALPLLLLVFMKVRQNQVRHSMKERLEQESLVNVIVSENEIVWIKKDKEILLQGKMFDIKSFSLHKDGYHISGLYDDKETELLNQWQEEQSSRNEKDNLLIMAFVQLFSFSQNNGPQLIYFSAVVNYPDSPAWLLSDGDHSVLTPPPQNS